MKTTDVVIGEVYRVKVGDSVVDVRVESRSSSRTRRGGERPTWTRTNLRTRRKVTVRSPQRFRAWVPPGQIGLLK